MIIKLFCYKYKRYLYLIPITIFIILISCFIKDKIEIFIRKIQISKLENSPPKQDVLKIREFLFFNFNNPYSLLKSYEEDRSVLSITNNGKYKVHVSPCEVFYTYDKIKRAINIQENDFPEVKIRKIYNFIHLVHHQSYPLFIGDILHSPVFFLNTFGSGFCDDWAMNFGALVALFGFEYRIWELSGHVVAEVKYDESWHVFDPSFLGLEDFYDDKGNVPDMPYVVRLAQQGKLSQFNKEFRTVENNKCYPKIEIQEKKEVSPYLDFFPGEKKYFFSKAFVLSTDGKQFEKYDFLDTLFFTPYKTMANFIREIPLNHPLPSDEIILSDYFPLAGVLVLLPDDSPVSEEELPFAGFDTKNLQKGMLPVKAVILNKKSLKGNYLNLSMAVKNFEALPSFSIQIRNLNPLIRHYKKIRILTVHYYCSANARFDDKPLRDLTEKGLVVTDKRG